MKEYALRFGEVDFVDLGYATFEYADLLQLGRLEYAQSATQCVAEGRLKERE